MLTVNLSKHLIKVCIDEQLSSRTLLCQLQIGTCQEHCQQPNSKGICHLPLWISWASLVAQRVKHLPVMWESQVWSLGGKIPWRRKWQPTPVFLPGESHGQRSLVGYSPQGHKESVGHSWATTLTLSVDIEPCAAVAIDFQYPLREVTVEWGTVCSRESDGTGLK